MSIRRLMIVLAVVAAVAIGSGPVLGPLVTDLGLTNAYLSQFAAADQSWGWVFRWGGVIAGLVIALVAYLGWKMFKALSKLVVLVWILAAVWALSTLVDFSVPVAVSSYLPGQGSGMHSLLGAVDGWLHGLAAMVSGGAVGAGATLSGIWAWPRMFARATRNLALGLFAISAAVLALTLGTGSALFTELPAGLWQRMQTVAAAVWWPVWVIASTTILPRR